MSYRNLLIIYFTEAKEKQFVFTVPCHYIPFQQSTCGRADGHRLNAVLLLTKINHVAVSSDESTASCDTERNTIHE